MRVGGDASSPEVGCVLDGRYRLDAPLGEGGLGVVWRGFHLRLGKPVAVKLMLPEHLGRENLRARFEREARSLAALSHPNIVDVLDFGVEGEAPFLVMELLEGRPLDRAIQDGIAPERALAIGRDTLRALGHAHALGIVHRDLKPANVFLQRLSDGSEVVRVLDFGLAKFLERDGREGQPQLTRAGTVLGTPAYMAPEQATGGSADARADVYSFGVVLFELITGRRPFQGEGGELIRQHLLVAMPSIESVRPDLEVAPELEAVLQRATAKSPAGRYASANELMQDVFSLPSPAIRARPGVARAPITRDATADDVTSAGGRDPSGPAAARERSITGHEPTQVLMGSTEPARPLLRRGLTPPSEPSAPVMASATVPMPATPSMSGPSGTMPMPAAPSMSASSQSPGYAAAPSPAYAAAPSPRYGAAGDHSIPSDSVALEARSALVEPRRGLGLGAWLGIGAVITIPIALGVVGFIVWQTMNAAPTAAPVPPSEPTAVTTTEEVREDAPPFFEPDPDPWAEDVPPQLAAIRERIEQGRPLTRGNRSVIRRMVRDRTDPRPWLVLAHGGLLEGARTDACEFYENALEIDVRRARGDAHVLPDLVLLVAHRAVTDRAAEIVRRYWGARALGAVDAQLVRSRAEDDDDGVARLQRLREQLAAGASATVAPGP